MSASDPALATAFCGISLKNPVIAASGTFAYGLEFDQLVELNANRSKAIFRLESLKPQPG